MRNADSKAVYSISSVSWMLLDIQCRVSGPFRLEQRSLRLVFSNGWSFFFCSSVSVIVFVSLNQGIFTPWSTYIVHVTRATLWAVVVSGTDIVAFVEDSKLLRSSGTGGRGDSCCVCHTKKGREGQEIAEVHCAMAFNCVLVGFSKGRMC